MKYNRDLMMAILWDRMPYLAEVVNTEVITLEDAPEAYKVFSDGSPKKFVIDPHGSIKNGRTGDEKEQTASDRDFKRELTRAR